MTNFLSKSSDKDFQKIMEMILRRHDQIMNEQKAQRLDIAELKMLIIKYHGDASPYHIVEAGTESEQ